MFPSNKLRFHPLAGLVLILAALLTAAVVNWRQPLAHAEEASPRGDAAGSAAPGMHVSPAQAGTAKVPLKRVVLFSSGVGYFEHDGQVTGDAKVDLKFKVNDINDLLKSMVVQDFDGGHISTVGYGSNDPLDKRLGSFAVNLNGNPSLAQLLEQIRGEEVEADAPNKIVGRIVSIESRKTEVGKEHFIEQTLMNVATDGGLRSVILESAGSIRLLNPKLDAELHKALGVLATAHDTDKKTVSLDFRGAGKRNVRVGYIEETPIWKTSYRLVLSDEKKPFLQGWAIVENPSEEDWSDVRLSLVSGRPISFTMNLYQPTYIPRPEAHLELFSSLGPQLYEQDLAKRDMDFRRAGAPNQMATAAPMAAAPAIPMARGPMVMEEKDKMEMQEHAQSLVELPALNPGQGVQSAATAGNVGELFQYAIQTPVTLSRHESAMLPILNSDVKAEKVSIYNPAVQAKHPLNGFRLTNSTNLHLMQGPITVFDGDMYAGDAMIQDIPPGSQRLVSYALDLDTEVAPQSKGGPEQILAIRIVKGTLIIDRKYTRSQEYTVKNSGKKAKQVLIEYAHDPNWRLVSPKAPAETTRDMYRFAIEAQPGEPAKLTVDEERQEPQRIAMTNVGDSMIALYSRSNKMSDKVRRALASVIRQEQAIHDVAGKWIELEQRIRTIETEQARIRDNMGQLDHGADLYKRYVKKFSDQEDEIEKIRPQIEDLKAHVAELRKALDDFLIGLDVT